MTFTGPLRDEERAAIEAGMAWARAWRARNKPIYDRLFGPEHASHGLRSQEYKGRRMPGRRTP